MVCTVVAKLRSKGSIPAVEIFFGMNEQLKDYFGNSANLTFIIAIQKAELTDL